LRRSSSSIENSPAKSVARFIKRATARPSR
jgi:hypothetical protein